MVAFVLGAVVSPTDTVVATAIASRLGVPQRIITIIKSESPVNDASALAIDKVAIAAVVPVGFLLPRAGRDSSSPGRWGSRLVELRNRDVIGDEILRLIQREFDLERVRFGSSPPARKWHHRLNTLHECPL